MTYTAEQVIALWQEDARARGRFPTIMPSGPSRGALAERYKDAAGVYRYGLAPESVEAVHQAIIAQENSDIAWGRRAQMLHDALFGVTDWITALPRDLVAKVLGVPSWVITALALGAILLLGKQFFGSRR